LVLSPFRLEVVGDGVSDVFKLLKVDFGMNDDRLSFGPEGNRLSRPSFNWNHFSPPKQKSPTGREKNGSGEKIIWLNPPCKEGPKDGGGEDAPGNYRVEGNLEMIIGKQKGGMTRHGFSKKKKKKRRGWRKERKQNLSINLKGREGGKNII